MAMRLVKPQEFANGDVDHVDALGLVA